MCMSGDVAAGKPPPPEFWDNKEEYSLQGNPSVRT